MPHLERSFYLDQLDVTLTYYDTVYNFTQNQTFAIRDSVGIVTNYLSDEEIEELYKPGGASEKIREYVAQKYIDLGYTRVANDQEFDFGVNLVAMMMQSTTVVGYPPGYWWGYGGYWGWYGGWYPPYYGWYPWSYTAYQTNTGTILMEFATGESIRAYNEFIENKTDDELENMPPDQIPAIEFKWQSLVSGALGTDASYNAQRAQRGIDEAIEQSPYLKKN